MGGEQLPYLEIDAKGTLKHPPMKKLEVPVRTVKIKLHPRRERDSSNLNKIFGVTRWTYNACVALLKKEDTEVRRLTSTDPKTNKPPAMMKFLRAELINGDSPAVSAHPWLNDVSYDIRDDACKDVMTALKANFTQKRNGVIKQFSLGFRSKKKCTSESFYVRKGWVSQTKNTLVLKLPKIPPMKLWTGNRAWHGPILMDCKLQRTSTNDYFLCIPHGYVVENQDHKNLRVCSLDPGVRTFQTIFDVNEGAALQVGDGDMKRIVRLCKGMDLLISKRDKAANAKTRYALNRALKRSRVRLQNLVNEVHKQLAKHLSTHYDLVMIPSFEVSQMIRKRDRKIGSQSARQMTTWAHYRFKQRLLFKCRQFGCKVVIVDESWTSKTCSQCGTLNHTLGASKHFHCNSCHFEADRDINGAKNIFLKNYEALGLTLPTLGPTPCSPVMDCCTRDTKG